MRGNAGWQSEGRKANESSEQTRGGDGVREEDMREGWRIRWVRGDEK